MKEEQQQTVGNFGTLNLVQEENRSQMKV